MPDYADANPVYTAIPNTIGYNNFPWPEPADKQQKAIKTIAQGILDARAKFPDSQRWPIRSNNHAAGTRRCTPQTGQSSGRRVWQKKIVRVGSGTRRFSVRALPATR